MIDKGSALEELYIGSNFITSKSGERIFSCLANNKSIKVFDYSLNHLGDGDIDMACAKSISNCFIKNKTLMHVDLSSNSFD